MKGFFIIYLVSLSSILSLAQNIGIQKEYNSEITKVENDSTHISVTNQLSNWEYGAALFLGYNKLTGDLESKFKNSLSFGISWSFEYKNIIALGLEYSYGASKTKVDIPIEDRSWYEGYRANFDHFELFLGTKVFEKEVFSFMPFLGMALSEIRSKDKETYVYYIDPNLLPPYKQERFDRISPVFGCILFIKTTKENTYNDRSYGGIRIKYTYSRPNFDKKYDMFGGEIHAITVGFAGFLRKEKRKVG